MSSLKKIKSNNFLNALLIISCFLLVIGCNSGSKPAETNEKSTPVTESKNSVVGTWVGKAYDGKTELKMIFTETDWTLISGGKDVMTRKYTLKGSKIEVQDSDGKTLPLKLSLDGNVLNAESDAGKTTLKRQ